MTDCRRAASDRLTSSAPLRANCSEPGEWEQRSSGRMSPDAPQDDEGLGGRGGRPELAIPAVVRHDRVRPWRQFPVPQPAAAGPAVELDPAQDLCPRPHYHPARRLIDRATTCAHPDQEGHDMLEAE